MMQSGEWSNPGNSEFSPYEIRILGKLDGRWSEWFDGIRLQLFQSPDRLPQTILLCPSFDQSKLRGIMNKLWDLNLCILSVNRLNQLPNNSLPEETAFDKGENSVQHGAKR
jgi:hypothetical protein